MSKRAGNFVTLADVVREVGKDVVRFTMLTRKADAQMDFDFAKVVEASKDNPVFYVQYAHARISSLGRRAEEAGIALPAPDLRSEEHTSELQSLMRISYAVFCLKKKQNTHKLSSQVPQLTSPHEISTPCLRTAQKRTPLYSHNSSNTYNI